MDATVRDGEYFRVADPSWNDPLDGSHSMRYGGRWSPPNSFPVTYLNSDREAARANARRMLTKNLEGLPFTADDIEPSELPVLVGVNVPSGAYLDVVTPVAIIRNGLPPTYPMDVSGTLVPWDVCQPIGQCAWDGDLQGVACLSAADKAPPDGEELAFFWRDGVTVAFGEPQSFESWYGSFDW